MGVKFGPGNQAAKGKQNRHKGALISTFLKDIMTTGEVTAPDGSKMSYSEAAAQRLIRKALQEGDVTAIRLIMDRTEGSVPIKAQLESQEGEAASVFIVTAKVSMDEWTKRYHEEQSASGAPSPDKPKPSPAQPSSFSSEEPKEEGRPTSSSGTSSRASRNGGKRGKASSSGGHTRNSTR